MTQPPADTADGSPTTQQPQRRAPDRNFAARLFGYDVFISFALGPPPRGSHSYASDLARRLRERDFTVFFSEDEAPPGVQLDSTLRNALHRSKTLVVIANRGTLEEPRWVRKEVEEFRSLRPPRPIIPISIGGALQDPAVATRVREWLEFQDKIWLDESAESAMAGIASTGLIERLALAPNRVRSNVWWRWLIRGVVTALVALAVALGIAAKVARDQREVAEQRLYDSNMNLANQAQMAGNPARANELLKEYLPAAGKQDRRSFPWYHLWHEGHHERATLEGHADTVTCVAFSPDSRTLASGSADLTVRLWDVASRKPLGGPLEGHAATVGSLAFSPDHQLLASADVTGNVILWRRSPDPSLWEKDSHTFEGHRVAFSPDGRTLAAAGSGGIVRLWDTGTWTELTPFPPGDGSPTVTAITFSPDGGTLALGGDGGAVGLWDTRTRQLLATMPLTGDAGPVESIVFSPDGTALAASTSDNTVQRWDVTNREAPRLLEPLVGHTSFVHSVAVSPDGNTLASASEDQTVRLWDSDTGRLLATLRGHERWLLAVAFSPDGRTLASAGWDKTVKLWDPDTRAELTVLTTRPPTPNIRSLAFSPPDGRTLASASDLGTVQLWDAIHRTVLGAPLGMRSVSVNAVAFSADGRMLAIARRDAAVELWQVEVPHEPRELPMLTGHSAPVRSVAFSPDRPILASAADDGTVKLWNVDNPNALRELGTFQGHSGPVCSVAFSPDGKTLASASEDRTVKLWDAGTFQVLATITPSEHSGHVQSITFSPDGGTLAAAGPNNTVTLWRVTNRKFPKALPTLTGHSRYVRSIAFSPDGRTLASGSDDRTVRLWDTQTWQETATLPEHAAPVVSVVFSRSGKPTASTGNGLVLASASDDGTVRLWSAATEEVVALQRGR